MTPSSRAESTRYVCPRHGVLAAYQVMNDGCDNAVCAVGEPGSLCFKVVRREVVR